MRLVIPQTLSNHKNLKPDLAFAEGENKVFAKIITIEELNERNTILDSISKSVAFLKQANMVYVILPKLYASIIDGNIFYEHGLGLVTYDEKAIHEVIKPKIFDQEPKPERAELPNRFPGEINELKDRIKSLEQEVGTLRSQLNEIRTRDRNVEILSRGTESSEINIPTQYEDAPEFMKDNPWIEILSKRGRE